MNNQSHMPRRQLTLIAKDGGVCLGWINYQPASPPTTDSIQPEINSNSHADCGTGSGSGSTC